MPVRTPLAKALAEGRHIEHPARFKGRSEPTTAPLGDPPSYLALDELYAWRCFQREVPWLMESDRCLVELACRLRTRMWADGGVKAAMLLLRCLSLMGATPATRSTISMPPSREFDPAEEFMQ